MRARLTPLLVALVALLVPGMVVAVAGANAGQVFVKTAIDIDTVKVRPHEIILSADGTLALEAVKYESYGGPVAKATATAYTRGCVPDCAGGKVLRPRATVRFSDLVKCERQMIYGRLSYVLHGAIPVGFQRRASFDLRLTDERGKPVC